MAKIIDMELINTQHGYAVIHRHGEDIPKSACIGWERRAPGVWPQRHVQGYGRICKECKRPFPQPSEMEEYYQERLKDPEPIEHVEVKHWGKG